MVSRLATGSTGYGSAAGNWACCGSGKTIGCDVTLNSLEPRIYCCNVYSGVSKNTKNKRRKQNFNTLLPYLQQTCQSTSLSIQANKTLPFLRR